MRKSRKIRSARTYVLFSNTFSVIYRLVVREWEVVGSGKLYSQTESSSYIYIYMHTYCSLLQFLADCFPWRMPRLSLTRTGNNIARWRTGLAKHDSVQLCNSLIFHFLDATPLAALGGCGSHKKFDLRGHEFYFLIFLVLYRLVVREWEVVGSGKLYSQTESSSYIYIYAYILFVVAIPCWLFSMEDAKTIVDSYWQQYCQMKDWIGQAWFCATLQLFDFSLFGCQIFLLLHSEDAEVTKNSICEDMSSIF